MNKVYLIGRVTRDLELKYFSDGERSYVRFTLAVEDYNTTSKESSTNFIDIVAFDNKAEILSKYVAKGNKLSVEGRVKPSSYIDKNNIKKFKVDIILDSFDFINNNSNAI